MENARFLLNISLMFGAAGCFAFVVLEIAKRFVERGFIRATALQAYAKLVAGGGVSFESLREAYKLQMKEVVGFSGDLTKHEAWLVFSMIKSLVREDEGLDAERKKWIMRSTRRAIPRGLAGAKGEYFLIGIPTATLLFGLQRLGPLIASPGGGDGIGTAAAMTIIPAVFLMIFAVLMVVWAQRSARIMARAARSPIQP